ncbi:MAG: hypothetical protein EHM28_06180 [Spirochaetaceae bacterium]|nr:MAG: hypothetical protein EHM28_06180 [Spirochaetaceae bacterium]
MKAFFLWAGIFAAAYVGLSAGTHLTQSAVSHRILVAVDVSGSMEAYKHRLPEVLASLGSVPYSKFKIITNSPNLQYQVIQDWSDKMDFSHLIQIKMYAPLDLEKLINSPDIASADEVIFITNSSDTGKLAGVPKSRIINVK